MIELTPVARLGLLLVRPGMLVLAAPAFGRRFAPRAGEDRHRRCCSRWRWCRVVALPETIDPAAIAVIAMREVVIGLALALSVRIVVAGAELAGHLAGFQLGFSYALAGRSAERRAQQHAERRSTRNIALMIFLSINGHHEMLRALATSYQALPIGLGGVSGDLAGLVARMLGADLRRRRAARGAGRARAAGRRKLALGADGARRCPSLNLMTTAAPVRLLVGLIVLAATLPLLPARRQERGRCPRCDSPRGWPRRSAEAAATCPKSAQNNPPQEAARCPREGAGRAQQRGPRRVPARRRADRADLVRPGDGRRPVAPAWWPDSKRMGRMARRTRHRRATSPALADGDGR